MGLPGRDWASLVRVGDEAMKLRCPGKLALSIAIAMIATAPSMASTIL
jgi:hypothetical protein